MKISARAAKSWDKFEPTKNFAQLRKMVEQAKPYSGVLGNRIGGGYIFHLAHGVLEAIAQAPPEKNSRRTYFKCSVCEDKGYTIMYDDLLGKSMQVPCHECRQ